MAPTLGIDELEKLIDFRTSPTSLQEGRSFLAALARESAFLNARVFPLLEQAERGRDWYVAYRHDAPDSSYSLQVFVWPSGSRTEIHDHSSWGAFCCVVGSLLETRYGSINSISRGAMLAGSGHRGGPGLLLISPGALLLRQDPRCFFSLG